MRSKKYNRKTKFLVLVCLVATIVAGFSSTIYLGSTSAQSKTLNESTGIKGTIINATKINIVLVHGIGFDGSSWSKVIPILQNAGHNVIAVQLPLHSLADDVATVKRAIDFIGGPVILVGHSYGGVVITNAAYNNPNVKGLVYIAAVAPNEGQSLSNFVDVKKFPKDLLIIDSGGFAYINPAMFAGAIAQDVNPTEADILAAVQKPFSTSILAEKSGPTAWKQLPTWYQVSANARASPPALERMFAKQMNATTISLPSSHASLVSHPNEIAQLILNATKGRLLNTLRGPSTVSSVAISSDNTKIVSGSWDSTIKVWDLNTGVLLNTLEGHSDSVGSVAITSDNSKIVSGSSDKTIKVWDLDRGKCYLRYKFDAYVGSALSKNGNFIALAGPLGDVYFGSLYA